MKIYKILNGKTKLVRKTTAVFMAVTFTFLPTGCSNEEVNNAETEQIQNEVETNIEIKEQDVIDYLLVKYDKLSEYLNSANKEKFNYEINQTLAEMAGFMFYDDPILGYSLNDLTETGKQKAGEIWQNTVLLMEEKYPEFVGDVSDGFNSAKTKGIELFNNGSDALDEALKNTLGSDTYDNIKQSTSDEINKIKQKTYDWYQKYNDEN